ncbi:TolC family protein [Algoriphagus terrigena]|uniref:TolC family protein n=1 Tax=Algoriphagus terrigena TaxID=344884 RepID=UPI000404CC24|nr:TolC family protein [Algoriphagus terrigena]
METKHSKFRLPNSPSRWLSGLRGLGAFFLVLISLSVNAQSLDDYLIIAAENNPGLKAAYTRYEATLERTRQPGLPDPELQVGFFLKPMERFMGNQQADIQLMQMFPWFGMIGTQKEEANQMALAQYQLFLEEKNQLMYLVKSTWYEITKIREEIGIQQENLKILTQLETLALIKYQAAGGSPTSLPTPATVQKSSPSLSAGSAGMNSMAGNTSPTSPAMNSSMGGSSMASTGSAMSEILRLRVEIKELQNTLTQLEADLEPQQIKFNQLLNRGIREEFQLPKEFAPIALEAQKLAVLDSIRSSHPMLAMYDHEMAAYDQQARMARLDGRPMLGAGVNYMPFTARAENGMMMGGEDMVMPMVTMTLPIYRKKVNARIKEAELMKESAALERQKTENLLAMDWANAYRQWEDAERKLQLYAEQTELTQQNLELMSTAYTANQASLSDVLAVHHQFHDYQLKQLYAVYSQYLSLAQLEMLTSSSFSLD